MEHFAEHLAAVGLDDVAGVPLQRMTESVIHRYEVPGVAAGLHQRAARRDRERVSVIGPVEAVGRTGRARDLRGRRTHHDIDLLLLGGDLLHGKRHRRSCEVGDHVDAFGIVPAASDGGGEIGLVLVIGGDQLDLLAQQAAPEILDRHLRGFNRPFPAKIGVNSGLVVQNTDLYALRRRRRTDKRAARHDGGGYQMEYLDVAAHVFLPVTVDPRGDTNVARDLGWAKRSPPAAGTIDRFIHQGARKRMRTLPRRWHLDRCRFTLKRRAARAFRLSIASGAPTPPAPRLVLPASGTRTQTESLPRSAALSLATDLVGAPSAPLLRRHPQLDQPVDDCVGLIFVVGGRMPTRLSPSRVEPRPSAHSLSPSRQPAARDRLDDLERDDRARAAPFSKSPSICPI